jgi:hypothetical protein
VPLQLDTHNVKNRLLRHKTHVQVADNFVVIATFVFQNVDGHNLMILSFYIQNSAVGAFK